MIFKRIFGRFKNKGLEYRMNYENLDSGIKFKKNFYNDGKLYNWIKDGIIIDAVSLINGQIVMTGIVGKEDILITIKKYANGILGIFDDEMGFSKLLQ